MGNLRLKDIKVSDSVTVKALFTDALNPSISKNNLTIKSNIPNIPDVEVLSVTIQQNILVATTRPMTPQASYFVTFKSTDLVKFNSLNGQNTLFEDGKTNVALIIGADDPANPYRDEIISTISGNNIYNMSSQTLIRTFLNCYSDDIKRAASDIGQAKNDNYLSKTIIDEVKTRGSGPYDRLDEEGSYEIIRVGKTVTEYNATSSISFASIPRGPITLQGVKVNSEKLIAGYGKGTFNGFLLEVNNTPVTKLTSVTFVYKNGSKFIYNLRTYGYQIYNTRYDQDFSSTLLSLKENQFQLNSDILNIPGFVLPTVGDFIYVNYEFKSLGTVIDENSVTLSQIKSSIREVTPPLLTQFSLKNAPVVNGSDNILSSGGISFLDPNSNPPFSKTHPAFKYEIPLRLDGLPNQPGQFAVDYTLGKVYVYGESTNDGTGNLPPVATYKYRKYFTPNLDYTYNPETLELAASPLRDVIGQEGKINFNFQNVLIPGVDYKAQIHKEVLDERVNNNLISINALRVKNLPITNAFRVYNETSGEVYQILRFDQDTVYFSYNVPPSIIDTARERASFTNVLNELLIINSERINTLGVRVLTILLSNNNIISQTEDTLGSSFNSSAVFSKNDLFNQEIYFDGQELTVIQNTNRLLVNQYQIDYKNGVVYVGVLNSQDQDIGTISYKKGVIAPEHPHVVAVSEIYNSISFTSGISKLINYISFSEGAITPETFDLCDERFLNGDITQSYFLNNNTITVTDDIKTVRGIYDAFDLNNHTVPINFALGATHNYNVITVSSTGIQQIKKYNIINTNQINVQFLSSGIEIASVSSVVRDSDNLQLWDGYGTFTGNTIYLSGINSPSTGETVTVIYNVKLNGSCTPIIDYNRGDYFIDYTYVADEILVTYEHGDNCLDFRESGALKTGETYYVSYKVGALRDALLKNFGSLIDLSIINSFDTSVPRENYRDVLMAALQSFTKGPTIPALKLIVSTITKIDPEIIEEVFQEWALGVGYLYRNPIKTTGELKLLPGKFNYGVLIDKKEDSISFPVSSNLKLDEGTLETWIIPEWNGLDNDATLSFKDIKRDGYFLPQNKIFIGSGSIHPILKDNKFILNKNDVRSPIGIPSAIHTENYGLFIYYDDIAGRWNLIVKDSTDGYAEHIYNGIIQTSGEMYDVKFIDTFGKIDDTLRSSNKQIEFLFKISDGYLPDTYSPIFGYNGLTFMSDDLHYLFDFGESESTNRFSIYKDGKGYLNFEVFDNGKRIKNRKSSYKVSADISNWRAGEKHHVATSWIINSNDQKDELHLFIDGLEVPNIMRYGGRPVASTSDRFRTVNPEYVVGTVPKNTVTYNDLTTNVGSNIVSSATINFSSLGIAINDTIAIKEIGFGTYTITNIIGNSLQLNAAMPANLTDARFSVNPYTVSVSSEIDISSNIAVSIIHSGVETEIPGVRADIPGYEIYKNLLNQNILTILGDALAGDQIVIRTLGLNHRRARDTVYEWGNTNSILKTQLPPPIYLDAVKIIPILLPLFVVGYSNPYFSSGPGTITPSGTSFVANNIITSQPSNNITGRTLTARISGGNINFTTPAQIQIDGYNNLGLISETLTFTSATTLETINKFAGITNVKVTITPFDSTKDLGLIELKELYSITKPENSYNFPVIRFSYKRQHGIKLSGNGSDIVTDNNGIFFQEDVNCLLQITSPSSVTGTYKIIERIDNNNIRIFPSPPASFINGVYDIYNTTIGRSGFQNGFFFLEQAGTVNVPFTLNQGMYELDYPAYLEIPFDLPKNINAFVGSDLNKNHQAKAILDEFRILSRKLTDTRIGETIPLNQYSVTTDYNSLKPFTKNNSTLMLLHFDSKPFKNDSDYYISNDRYFIQSSTSVNQNFDQSVVIEDRPIIIDNKGILTTNNEGTIEFWVSPKYDTYNDPEERYYFDSTSATIEETTSITKGIVKTSGRINKVLSVRLLTDKNNTGIDYFDNGTIGKDFQTIYLKRQLPYQKVPVVINYIPSGYVGERFSIFKDKNGFITFKVSVGGVDYVASQPVFWPRNSWHRIRATFKFNRKDNKDEIRLFVDGEERGIIRFGTGLLFGPTYVFGQGFSSVSNQILIADINFKDPLNQLFIGSDYLKAKSAMARFDNIKISNISRLPVNVGGQPRDVNYNSNLSLIYPAVEDVYTTYLANFDSFIKQANDFALLKSSNYGNNNFTINVIDSFDIVSNNNKLKQMLEALIASLKPAQTISTINYVK